MYQSFTIRNFRGFEQLQIDSLARINLLTGKNNVGKTAVLEAVFLHAGRHNSDLPARIEAIRGQGVFPLSPKGIWGWLFHRRDVDSEIELTGAHEDGRACTLTIRLAETGTSVTPTADIVSSLSSTDVSDSTADLVLEYTGPDGRPRSARAHIEKDTVKTEQAERRPDRSCIYLAARARVNPDTAERFSRVDDVGGLGDIVDILKHVDPRLERLTLGFEARRPVIKCDIGLPELIPIHIMGEGMNRLLKLILAIYDSQDGTVLIDEVDNGLDHAALPGIWKAIAYVARKRNVGVMATTHSWECVKYAFHALEKDAEDNLALYRLDRDRNEEIRVARFGREDWERAMK